MRTLVLACGLTLGLTTLAATNASACGWSAKTAEVSTPKQTVMAPQTPAPKPLSGG